MHNEHIRDVALDLVLTLLTFGLFNIYVQYRQMRAVNALLKTEKYAFWRWALFTFFTVGLYHIYHEYRMSTDLVHLGNREGATEPMIGVLLTCTGFHIVLDAIQQTQINQLFGEHRL